MNEYAANDPWSKRWRELDETLPRQNEPTAEEVEDAKLKLLQEVTFTDDELAERGDRDDLVELTVDVLDDPEALRVYAGARARHARMDSILASEGLTPPARDELSD